MTCAAERDSCGIKHTPRFMEITTRFQHKVITEIM
jgi:hypothetical protein